jgi:outer membrane protein assembly factor BamB
MARDAVPFVVVVDDDLRAKAFEMADGRERWASKVGGAGSPEVTPLALSGGRVLVADRLAGMTLFDDNGKPQWSARVDAAAIRGGPAGPALGGRYALALVRGSFLLAGPGRGQLTIQPPGGVANGAARGPGGVLYVSTAQGSDNQLVAYRSDAVER